MVRRHAAAEDRARIALLGEVKGARSVSVCLPARNEAATIGGIVSSIHAHLAGPHGIVDEVIVLDHGSHDGTASVAARSGASVVIADAVPPAFGPAIGKGDVLWRSLFVAEGDIIVWIDADLTSFSPDYVTRLLAPLLVDDEIMLVKAMYRRSLGGKPEEGGRVTELTARPALKLLFPELAHIRQPLGGEYAIRRSAAERLEFEVDYGVEMGILLDVAREHGPRAVAQADLGERVHRNRPLHELHEQSVQVLRTILDRAGLHDGGAPRRPAASALATGMPAA